MELITLQFGQLANYAGSHLWNFEDELSRYNGQGAMVAAVDELKEDENRGSGGGGSGREVDPSCMLWHREAANKFIPRMVAFDLSGAFGALEDPGEGPAGSAAAAADLGALQWDAGVRRQDRASVPKHSFQQYLSLESQAHSRAAAGGDDQASPVLPTQSPLEAFNSTPVRFWTDYIKVDLEPNNMFSIPGHQLGLTAFDDEQQGRELITSQLGEEMFDRLRWHAEACDHLQGLQVLVDVDSAWSGVAVAYLEEARDAYGAKLPVFTAALHMDARLGELHRRQLRASLMGSEQQWASTQQWSRGVGLAQLAQLSSICSSLPCGLPNDLVSGHTLFYESTATVAAALHSLSMPCRLYSAPQSLHAVAQSLTARASHMNLLHTSFRAGFDWQDVPGALARLANLSAPPTKFTVPGQPRQLQLAQFSVLRGLPTATAAASSRTPRAEQPSADKLREQFDAAVARSTRTLATQTSFLENPMPLPVTFPSTSLWKLPESQAEVAVVAALSSPLALIREQLAEHKNSLAKHVLSRRRQDESALAQEWYAEQGDLCDDLLDQQ